MIYALSNKISITLNKKGYIALDELDVIRYGLFTILSRFLYCLISLIIGFLFDCIIDSLVFYLSFLFVKKYAGGIHASTEQRCFVYSTFSIVCSIGCIRLAMNYEHFGWIAIGVAFISTFFICRYAPIPAREKSIDFIERKRYSRISKIRVFILWTIILMLFIAKINNLIYAISIAIVLESILLLIGKKALRIKLSDDIA